MIVAIHILTLVLCIFANLVALCALALVTKVHESIVKDQRRAATKRTDLLSALAGAKTKAEEKGRRH